MHDGRIRTHRVRVDFGAAIDKQFADSQMSLGRCTLQRRPIFFIVPLTSMHETGIALEQIANCFKVSSLDMRNNLLRIHGRE
jgi:hypothetical protein